ncbi:MAG TPA: TetR/AcrR family transcriptional regulator [Alphaproteobacteria bacterium]|nr:TetR/AcrR family transcriptional regulator [Alphaproteobacteria bacterium]
MIKSNDQRTGAPDVRDPDGPTEDTELRILEAARRVFLRRGTAGARMAEIAEEAGVNQALLHYYFRSKAGLAEAVFQRAAGDLFPAVVEILSSEAPLEEKVRRVVEVELDTLIRHPFLPGYVLSELNHHPGRVEQLIEALAGVRVGEVGPRMFERLGAQIEAAVDAGRMRSVAPEQFVINLLSLCIFPFAARPLIAAITRMDEDEFRAMIRRRRSELPEFFLRGLRP